MKYSFLHSHSQNGSMERVVLGFYLVHDILEREAQIREDKLFCERMKNETMMYHNKLVISDGGTLIMES